MPIWEFECPKCKKIETIFWRKKEEKIDGIYCMKCNELMKRILSKCNFDLKGFCWSKDGYSRGKG